MGGGAGVVLLLRTELTLTLSLGEGRSVLSSVSAGVLGASLMTDSASDSWIGPELASSIALEALISSRGPCSAPSMATCKSDDAVEQAASRSVSTFSNTACAPQPVDFQAYMWQGPRGCHTLSSVPVWLQPGYHERCHWEGQGCTQNSQTDLASKQETFAKLLLVMQGKRSNCQSNVLLALGESRHPSEQLGSRS